MTKLTREEPIFSMNKSSIDTQSSHSQESQLFSSREKIAYNQTKTVSMSSDVLKRNRIISVNQNNAIINAYKILRTRVLQRMKQESWNTLGITSTNQNEGKSLTAINLAISLAQETRHTVMLVDFDLQSPSVHSYFEHAPEYGVSDYFLNDTPIEDMLFNPGIDGLVVLCSIRPVLNSSEVLSSTKAVELVDEVSKCYSDRIVIFDLPPLLDRDDVIAFSPYIECALLVIEDGKTGRDDLKQAVGYLEKTPVIGTVLNKSGGKSMMTN